MNCLLNYNYIYSFSWNNNTNTDFVYGDENDIVYNNIRENDIVSDKFKSYSPITGCYLEDNTILYGNRKGELFLKDIRDKNINVYININRKYIKLKHL